MADEDLGYKASVVEPAKFDYSPLGKVFTKGSDKVKDKKAGLFKRLKILKIKTKKRYKKLKIKKTKKSAKKDSETNKSKSSLIYSTKHSFYRYRLSEFNKISSIDPKFNKIEECDDKFIALKDVDVEPENIEHWSLLYWIKYQKFTTIWLESTKKLMTESLKMVKTIVGSENITLKIL